MHIAFIDNVCKPDTPGQGGHSDIIWAMAQQFVNSNVSVTIIGPYRSEIYPFYHSLLHVSTYKPLRNADQNGITRIISVLSALLVVKKYINSFDLIHVTDAFAAGVASSLIRKKPVVFTTSGSILQRQSSSAKLNFISAAFYYFVSYLAAQFTTAIIATSHEMKLWWIRTGSNPTKVSVIPLGSDVSPTIHNMKHSLPFKILFVGRLAPENNPEHLIRIWQMLQSKLESYELTIVGDGPLMQKLVEMFSRIQKKEAVHFLGTLPHDTLQTEYSKHHVLVITREAGAPPRVGIEALAKGMPIVAFLGNGLEDYTSSGTDLFVENHSLEELIEKISVLSSNPQLYNDMHADLIKACHRLNSWETVCSRIGHEVYESMTTCK